MTGSHELTLELATELYRRVNEGHARAFLDYLIAHPDQTVDSETIQRELSLPKHKQVALAAYAIGEGAGSLGLARPWTEGQRGYTMPKANARLLLDAKATLESR